MERQKQAWQDEEEEEGEEVCLLGRQSRHINNIYAKGKANENGDGRAVPVEEEANKELNHKKDGDELQRNRVYFDTQPGNVNVNGLSVMKSIGEEFSVSETKPRYEELHMKAEAIHIQTILSTDISHQNGKNLEDEIFSSLSPPPFGSSHEEESTNLEHFDNKTGVDADIDLIEEIDQELTETDVERVFQKQNTHDLYCPNCNSCITRRVILLRKKRKVRNICCRPKHDKYGTQSVVDANSVYAANGQAHDIFNSRSNDAPTHAADDDNYDRQPDVFRCLSCFSIFIPTGSGFKLFRIFGDKNENGKMQDVQSIPLSKTNRFFSIFASDNRKAAINQGNRAPEHSEVDGVDQRNSSCYSENTVCAHGNDHPVAPFDKRNPVKTGALEENSHVKSLQGGLDSLNHSKVESLLLEKPLMAIDHKTNIATGNQTLAHHNGFYLSTQDASWPIKSLCSGLFNSASIDSQEAGECTVHASTEELIHYDSVSSNVREKSTEDASSPINSICSVGLVNCALIDSQEAERATVNSSTKELIPYNNVSSDMGEKLDDTMVENKTGDDVIVIVETQPVEPSSSLRVQDVDTSVQAGILAESETEVHVAQYQVAAANDAHQWDILKSIVYGGLVESITSLCVVSSAAGAGAATLDVLALGLANLVGCLFIIGHNLRELGNDYSGETSTGMTEQNDRYQQLLGQRHKFSLHATVVILSFLIFGLVPPVVYGFSFRKSGSRDLKIAAVAGSSLACIFLLAVGKGHIQKPPKSYIKTILYYLSLGLMSSGVSYVVGHLIKEILEKINLSESNLDVTIPYAEKSGWASY